MDSLDGLVDTTAYPIGHASGVYDDLVHRCKAEMDETGLCVLRAPVVACMAQEVASLGDSAKRISALRTPYLSEDNRGFARGHPRSALFPQHMSYLCANDIFADSLLKQLFRQDKLTDFVADVLGGKQLYRSECPTLSVQVNIMHEGDVFPWHFDQTDGAVTLLLQAADAGGKFQYAPGIRGEAPSGGEIARRTTM